MNNRQHPLWQSVDVAIQKHWACPTNGTNDETTEHLLTGTKAHSFDSDVSYKQQGECVGVYAELLGFDDAGSEFMRELLSTASPAPVGRGRAAKLIIPRLRGYIVRADIIPLRMVQSPNMIQATYFADPQPWFAGEPLTDADFCQLPSVFRAAAGGIIIDVGGSEHDDVGEDLNIFDAEIQNRLSFPWVLEQRRPRQTLAFVGNCFRYPGHGGTGCNHYAFAKALDINLVALDAPGCWEAVRDGAMAYCQQKKDQHRFDGQRKFDITKAPTYDLIEREIII